MSPPMARRSLYRLRVVLVGMAAQAPVPRPAVPLPATRMRTSCFAISTAVVLETVAKLRKGAVNFLALVLTSVLFSLTGSHA